MRSRRLHDAWARCRAFTIVATPCCLVNRNFCVLYAVAIAEFLGSSFHLLYNTRDPPRSDIDYISSPPYFLILNVLEFFFIFSFLFCSELLQPFYSTHTFSEVSQDHVVNLQNGPMVRHPHVWKQRGSVLGRPLAHHVDYHRSSCYLETDKVSYWIFRR